MPAHRRYGTLRQLARLPDDLVRRRVNWRDVGIWLKVWWTGE